MKNLRNKKIGRILLISFFLGITILACSITPSQLGGKKKGKDSTLTPPATPTQPAPSETPIQPTPTTTPIQPTPSPTPAAKLSDYWQGKAIWKLQLVIPEQTNNPDWPGGFGAGSHITIGADNEWYLFTRHVYWENPSAACGNNPPIGTSIRVSRDKGKTWSKPQEVISPAVGSPWECMGGDGDAIYDKKANKWHYLFQCLATDSKWNGCHVEKNGKDPMPSAESSWVVDSYGMAQAVVISDRILWRQICDASGKRCTTPPSEWPSFLVPVKEEGTFNIFRQDDDGVFYVSFHGYDNVNGYRGLAKTRNFHDWFVGATAGLAGDSIFDPYVANSWRENWQGWTSFNGQETYVSQAWSAGGGGANIFFEDDANNPYYYMVVESVDLNLSCVAGQNWDMGILRQKDLKDSNWEQFPLGNPIFYSDKTVNPTGPFAGKITPCNIQYARLFRDPSDGSIYYHHFRLLSLNERFNGIILFKLEHKTNLLQNGDFWRCDADSWTADRVQLTVNRSDLLSSDSGCSMSLSCSDGGKCAVDGGIKQTATLATENDHPSQLRYGGKFFSTSPAAEVEATLEQYRSDKSLIRVDSVVLKLTSEFQTLVGTANLDSQSQSVTLRVRPTNPAAGIIADEMFMEPF